MNFFKTQLPEWKNEGTEPSDDLQNSGFKTGYKPAAGVFNWFWSLVLKAIKEIQEIISKTTPNIVVNAVREQTEDGKEIYVVTDSNITEVYNGLEITIIPNERNTTSSPRLKINDFEDKGIRLPLSFNCAATTTIEANYFQIDRPITLKYHSELNLGIQGMGAWIFTDRQKTSAQDLYGVVPIKSGGFKGVELGNAPFQVDPKEFDYFVVFIGNSDTPSSLLFTSVMKNFATCIAVCSQVDATQGTLTTYKLYFYEQDDSHLLDTDVTTFHIGTGETTTSDMGYHKIVGFKVVTE